MIDALICTDIVLHSLILQKLARYVDYLFGADIGLTRSPASIRVGHFVKVHS